MQAGALPSASAAPMAPQAEAGSSKRKRAGQGVKKKCGACGLHKCKEAGHTKATWPKHCLSCQQCRTEWQDPERRTGCSCQK